MHRNLTHFKIIGGLLLASNAWATTFMEVPLPAQIQEAPVLVRGRVGESYPNWGFGSDRIKRIYTYTELTVSEVLKGRLDPNKKSLLLRELGGEKDGVGMIVAGTASFARGEDVVVFLGALNPDGSRDLVGMETGKYLVERDKNGQEYMVGAASHDEHEGMLGNHEGHDDPAQRKKFTLEDVRKIIQDQSAKADSTKSQANSGVSNNSGGVSTGSASPLQNQSAGSEAAEGTQDGGRIRGKLLIGILLGGVLWFGRWMWRRR